MLLFFCGVIVLSFLLEVVSGDRVAFRGLPQYPLPETCMSKMWFGCECPGCGLTRSFIRLARGDWHGSLQMHRFGWLLALAVLTQIPYRLLAIRGLQRHYFPHPIPTIFSWSLIAILVGNWIWQQF